MTLHYTSYFVY